MANVVLSMTFVRVVISVAEKRIKTEPDRLPLLRYFLAANLDDFLFE